MINTPILIRATCALFMSVSICGRTADKKVTETAPMEVDGRLMLTTEDMADLPQERLIEMMGADLAWSRFAAAKVLANHGKASIPVFKRALSADDWRVVRAGVDGLLTVLATATKEKDDDLHKAVAETVPDVQKTLSHKHHAVRTGALQLLGKLGPDAAAAATDACALFTDKDFLTVAPTAIKTVAAIGVEHVDEKVFDKSLAQAIRSKDQSVRGAAVSVVAKLDEEKRRKFIPDMLDALRTPMKDGYTRFQLQGRIANVLYDLGEKEVLPLSIAILCQKGWGHSHRIKTFVPILEKFGPEAVSALPLLESYLAKINGKPEVRLPGPEAELLKNAIATIKGEKTEGEEK